MLGGLLKMWAQSVLSLGGILDTRLLDGAICIAELRRPAALASDVSFVIKFSTINQKMGPAQWANTCWEKHTSQS